MDKIPKFRRKPKPTVETTVERSSTDTASSITSSELPSPIPQSQQLNPHKPKSSKKAAFRNFRFRNSSKRAREPASVPSSPPPAIVTQDGVRSRPATAEGNNAMANGHGLAPRVPAFLNLAPYDVDFRFQELTWAERGRVLEGSRNESVPDFKWGFYKPTEEEDKPPMDRYINIKPWNHNRVKLQVPEDKPDYVNASAISLRSTHNPKQKPLDYIAMQGPTEPSFDSVWRMVSEQMSSPAVIVQLTTMCENGVIKCHQYFPDDEEYPTWTLNEEDAWGDGWSADLTLDSSEEIMDGAIEKRKLLLHVRGEDEPRIIWHFLYCRWPDFGVPEVEDLEGFFELMRLSREYSAPRNPRIIHCSAGVGRTGTFIALEHLTAELDAGAFEAHDEPNEGPDLVHGTVDALREQRIGMVQGKPQYAFIYQVMRKLWQDKYEAEEQEEEHEPAAKRLEVGSGEPRLEAGPSPDMNEE